MNRCVIIAGGEINDYGKLKQVISPDDYVICADSGLVHADNMGIQPDLIIGDFDSYKGDISSIEKIVLPEKKDDTDTHYAAKYAADMGFWNVLLCGVWGSRPDHSLAAVCTLKFLCDKNIKAQILADKFSMWMVNRSFEIAKQEGRYISILAYGGDALGVTLEGFEYPLSDAVVSCVHPIGISNRIISNVAKISVRQGCLLVISVDDRL
ncbi:MAG TPA: thiamine diphosphokinase [Clostridiales bacterium]|nr:thiamine diphosphokinase [Clostridiales bacterium]